MTFSWSLFEYFINIVEVCLMYIFIKNFFNIKELSKSKIFSILLIQSILMQFINVILGVANNVGFILVSASFIFLFRLIFDIDLPYLILGVLSFYMIFSVFEFIGVMGVTKIFNVSANEIVEFTKYRAISALSIRALFFIFLSLLKNIKINFKKIKRLYIYELLLVFLFNFITIFNIYSIYKDEFTSESQGKQVFIITFATAVSTIIIMGIINQIIKYSHKELEWNLREDEYQRQMVYMKSMEELTYRLKAQRHDFNHHIGCIYGLLESEDIDDAKIYTKNLINSVTEINNIVNIDNPIIASILNFKFSVAKEKGIQLNIKVNIPKEINIDPIDISIILGNAIDNAIEACEKCKKKMIDVNIYMQTHHLILKIKNTKPSYLISSVEKTSKSDKENHGFGLDNIKHVIEKYDGLLKIDTEGDFFILNIALKDQSK